MAFKTVILCASVLLVQDISARCISDNVNTGYGAGLAGSGIGLAGNAYGTGYAWGNTGYSGIGLGNALESVDRYGGSLLVTSSSPLAPSGLSVMSENSLEGALAVAGKLPFLGAVALEGTLPAGGTAQAAYGCGNGDVRILETYGTGAGYGAGASGLGLGAGAAGFGYGAGMADVRGGAADLGYGAGIISGNSGCGYRGKY